MPGAASRLQRAPSRNARGRDRVRKPGTPSVKRLSRGRFKRATPCGYDWPCTLGPSCGGSAAPRQQPGPRPGAEDPRRHCKRHSRALRVVAMATRTRRQARMENKDGAESDTEGAEERTGNASTPTPSDSRSQASGDSPRDEQEDTGRPRRRRRQVRPTASSVAMSDEEDDEDEPLAAKAFKPAQGASELGRRRTRNRTYTDSAQGRGRSQRDGST